MLAMVGSGCHVAWGAEMKRKAIASPSEATRGTAVKQPVPGKQAQHEPVSDRDGAGAWEDIAPVREGELGAAWAYRTSRVGTPRDAVRTVEGVGNTDTPLTELDDAIAKQDRARVLQLVRDMSTENRNAVSLENLARFMSARDIITIGGWVEAGTARTVTVALEARPKLTAEQLRAFVADLSPYQVTEALEEKGFVAEVRRAFPGVSPVELFPQLGEHGGLSSSTLLGWLIDIGPPKRVARLLVAVPPQLVKWHADRLDELGDRGWQWLEAIDSQLAGIAVAGTLEAYRKRAERRGKDVTQLARWVQVSGTESGRTRAERKADAQALQARRREVLAKSVPEIQQLMQHAGFSGAEQLDWILDKPGLTPSQMREVTQVMATAEIGFDSGLTAKLQKRFPQTSPEDLFSGDLPRSLVERGSRDRVLAKWLVGRAQPESILRIVVAELPLVAPWCETLKSIGTGLGWVYELGGQYNDYLLRRLVVHCPDAPVREYIQQRIFGGLDAPAQPSVTVPTQQPTAYTSARSHLDADLDRYKSKPSSRAGDVIAADVGDLTPAELDGLKRDAARLKQVLASANERTYVQILDHVQPTLQIGILYAPTKVNRAHLIGWMQSRPADEVTTALSSATTVNRIKDVIGLEPYGPLDLLPTSADARVLGIVLRQNPSIATWVLQSAPSRVLAAFAAPSVIEAAVDALSTLDAEDVDSWLPSVDALGPAGKSVLVQLGARAKGELKGVIERKLRAKPTRRTVGDEEDEDEDEDRAKAAATDQTARTLRGTGPFESRAKQLLADEAPAASVLALCRAEPAAWQRVADAPGLAPALQDYLALAPETVFVPIPLPALLTRVELHRWIMATTPAFKILNAIDASLDTVVTATLEATPDTAKQFFLDLPRGRALSPANKATLRRLSKVAQRFETVEKLFEITFDTRLLPFTKKGTHGQPDTIEKFERKELDKLWAVLELLPPAHVDQKSIEHFQSIPHSPDNNTAGVYDPQTQGIALQKGKLTAKDASAYDHGQRLTQAQAIHALGSQADLQRFLAEGLMVDNHDGTFSFKRQDTIETYPHTILHEVGHAVDAMMGSATELVYKLAGWKRFSVNDVDGWAAELGGWDAVSEPDKHEIRKAWKLWLNGGGKGTLAQLVGTEHVALAPRHASVGIVKAARLDLDSFELVNGLYTMASHSLQSFLTLTERGHDAAPSAYALSAPAEYFAECYAFYYDGFDGSPASAARKGRTLAPWIKTWMDTKVDAIGHNPTRHGRD